MTITLLKNRSPPEHRYLVGELWTDILFVISFIGKIWIEMDIVRLFCQINEKGNNNVIHTIFGNIAHILASYCWFACCWSHAYHKSHNLEVSNQSKRKFILRRTSVLVKNRSKRRSTPKHKLIKSIIDWIS